MVQRIEITRWTCEQDTGCGWRETRKVAPDAYQWGVRSREDLSYWND